MSSLKSHFIINKINYIILFSTTILVILFNHFIVSNLEDGEGAITAAVYMVIYVIFAIPVFGILIFTNTYKDFESSFRDYVYSIIIPFLSITVLYTLYLQFNPVASASNLVELLLTLMFPVLGLAIYMLLSYLYIEFYGDLGLNLKRIVFRNIVFLVYIIIYFILNAFIPINSRNTLLLVSSIVVFVDLTVMLIVILKKEI